MLYLPGHAMGSKRVSASLSPKNGNNADDVRRFSAKQAAGKRILGHGDGTLKARSPLTAGFFATLPRKSPVTALAG